MEKNKTQRQLARRTEPFQESVIREEIRLGDETGAVNRSQGLPNDDSPPEVLAARNCGGLMRLFNRIGNPEAQ